MMCSVGGAIRTSATLDYLKQPGTRALDSSLVYTTCCFQDSLMASFQRPIKSKSRGLGTAQK